MSAGILLADLAAEQRVLDEVLAGAPARAWSRATPAEGWTVADTVRHLAVSEVAATASVLRDRDLTSPDRLSLPAVEDGPALLRWWRDAREAALAAFAGREDNDRVPWGGRRMAVRSLATARLMETWAHGLDCFAALERRPVDTSRLRHIAWLGWRTLPYAFHVAGLSPPGDPTAIRVELVAPDERARWSYGPAGSVSMVTGGAGDWCRVVTHRLRRPATSSLHPSDELAAMALNVARAFL